MIAFFKRYEYYDIRDKLLLLYGLNTIDLLFTMFLIGTGYFTEGNPIMAHFMTTPLSSVLFKLVMPAALITMLIVRLRTATPQQRHYSNCFVNALLLIYMAVALLHIAWVIVYHWICI